MDKKTKITQEDKQKIADQIVDLIQQINTIIHTKELDTFDLRDIRNLIEVKSNHWEITDFKHCFQQIWNVWRD